MQSKTNNQLPPRRRLLNRVMLENEYFGADEDGFVHIMRAKIIRTDPFKKEN